MTETHQNGRKDQQQVPGDAKNPSQVSENDADIIELSDIAIGITQEDDVIVGLTEEVIGEAFVGFSGATSEVLQDDQREMDLSHARPGTDPSGNSASGIKQGDGSEDVSGAVVNEDENSEEDISRELDKYFGTEDDRTVPEKPAPAASRSADSTVPDRPKGKPEAIRSEEIRISSTHLDEAIERVIRKMFAEKINRVLDDVIERTVSEEISQLRDYLLGVSGKK